MINRFVFNGLRKELFQPEINILLGPRQVGKTTLLKRLELDARKAGKSTAYFDLEEPAVLASFNRKDQGVVDILRSAGDVVFIDEFHYLKNASKIFKAIFDGRSRNKIVCSGSSSIEIHKHLKESMAGRRILFQIFPLDYGELAAADPSLFTLSRYLRFGGMPGLVASTDSEDRTIQLLSELVGAYISKDIKSLLLEENIRAFNHLLYLLAERQGSIVSMHSLAREIGVSVPTVSRYLDILQATFVCFKVPSYSGNLGNELKKSSKYYLYDLGIRNSILKDFSAAETRQDKGALFETFVFLALKNRLKPNMEIKFWRNTAGEEVDFILLRDRKPLPIEVKSNLPGADVPQGLRRFLEKYPRTPVAYVVSQNQMGVTKVGNAEVRFVTLESFCSASGALSSVFA